MSSDHLYNLLIYCYIDSDHDQNEIFRSENGVDIIFVKKEVREFIQSLCERFIYNMTSTLQAGDGPPISVNVVPIRWSDKSPYINPDLQYFQQYFQCFFDFLTALLEVNYNEAFQQQGGKRKRTIKRVRKTRKTKMYKKIRTNRKK